VGISIDQRAVKLVTTRKVILKLASTNKDNHVTVLICANAEGQLAPSLYIMQSTVQDNFFEGIPDTELVATQASGFIDNILFEQWSVRFMNFIDEWNQTHNYSGYHILLTDGHKSRMNPKLLWSFLMKKIVVLCLPAHTTHLLQPNDQGLNRTFKSNLDSNLRTQIGNGVSVDKFNLISLAHGALHQDNIRPSIVNSWRHIGLVPFDRSKAVLLVNQLTPSRETQLVSAAELLYAHTDAMELARREPEIRRKRTRKQTGNTTRTQVLSKLNFIMDIEVSNLETEISSMPVEQLRDVLMNRFGIPPEEISRGTYKNGNPKFKPKEELLAIAKNHLVRLSATVSAARAQALEAVLQDPPMTIFLYENKSPRVSTSR
jgi:hypothetical protein